MTREEFAMAMADLTAGSGSKLEVSPEKLRVWYRCLKDFSGDALTAAIDRFLIEDGEWPTVAKLARYAREYDHGCLMPYTEALRIVGELIRRCGSYGAEQAMQSLDPISRHTVRILGGWGKICSWPTESRAAFHAQFRDAYKATAEIVEQRSLLPERIRPAIAFQKPSVKLIRDDKNEWAMEVKFREVPAEFLPSEPLQADAGTSSAFASDDDEVLTIERRETQSKQLVQRFMDD